MKIAILRDHHPESSEKWEIACRQFGIEYLSINMLRNDWLEFLYDFKPTFCVSRPPGDIQQNKKLFDEKLFYLEYHTDYKVYPGFLETYIYENKASLSWFLKTNNIPHPATFVSSSYEESIRFIDSARMPIVSKTLIGASGSGVKIIKSKEEAKNYIEKAFKTGIRRRYGPNKKTGSPKNWAIKAIKSPKYFLSKITQYNERVKDIQKGIVLFQEYINHPYEWRCVKIGDSYFAYKKLKIADQASGSKLFEYGEPPLELLNFTKSLCDKFKFQFMAVDIFYNETGIYVNELQTIFGHKNPYICKVNDTPGRYVFKKNSWIFEEGDFNVNESYNLRLKTAIDLYSHLKR